MGKIAPVPEGIGIFLPLEADTEQFAFQVTSLLLRLGSLEWCKTEILNTSTGRVFRVRLRKSLFSKWMEGFDTLALRRRLWQSSGPQDAELLMREVWVGMLGAPVRIDFMDLQELQAHLRIRCNIARAAEKTALAFKTDAAERPTDFWYDEPEVGFLLKPGACLVDALVAATQNVTDSAMKMQPATRARRSSTRVCGWLLTSALVCMFYVISERREEAARSCSQ